MSIWRVPHAASVAAPPSSSYANSFRPAVHAPGTLAYAGATVPMRSNNQPSTMTLKPSVGGLEADYHKLFGSDPNQRSGQKFQLKPNIKFNIATGKPVEPAPAKPRKWDQEPKEAQAKLKELQQSVAVFEQKNRELQQAVIQAESRAESAQARESEMGTRLDAASGEFKQLKADYEVLKVETIYVHQELQVILDENKKLKSLGSQSELALRQAAALLRGHEANKAHEANAMNERGISASKFSAVQMQLDALKPQMDLVKSQLASAKQELRDKDIQLKETMGFNKKSMSVTMKLNECVKSQDKEIAELKWTRGLQQNELNEKTLKIEALQTSAASAKAAAAEVAAAPSPSLAAELAAKDQQIAQLRQSLQEASKKTVQLEERQRFSIAWDVPKLSASAKEYLSQLSSPMKAAGTKRKLADDFDEPAAHLNKRALRNMLLSDAEINKDIETAMSQQQATMSKVQRSLQQQQKLLRDVQSEHEANLIRKRCLETRAKVLQEQASLVARLTDQVKQACSSGEQSVRIHKEQVAHLSNELEQKRSSLIETQLNSTELQVEVRLRANEPR